MKTKLSKKLITVTLSIVLIALSVTPAYAAHLKSEWQSWPNIYSGRAYTGYIFVIQMFLSSYDYTSSSYLGNVDGAWGPRTEQALRYYQGQKGLTQDAQCGYNTWGAMNDDCLSAPYDGGYIFMSFADPCEQVEICRKRSDGTWWSNFNSYRFR